MDEKQTQELHRASMEMMTSGPLRKGRLRRRLMIGHIVVFFAAVVVTMAALGIQLRLQSKRDEAKSMTAYANIAADNIKSEDHRWLAGQIKKIAQSKGKPDAEKRQQIEEVKNSDAFRRIKAKLDTVKSAEQHIAHIHTIVRVDEGLGAIVASNDPAEVGEPVHYADPDLAEMRKGFSEAAAGQEKIGGRQIASVAGYAPIESGESLVAVSRKMESMWDWIVGLGWIWLLPLAAGLGLGAFMAWREARAIMAPLQKTAEVIRRLSSGDMSARISPYDPKVTRVLRKSVVELGTSLERRQRISAYYGRTLTPGMLEKIMEAGEERLTRIEKRRVSFLRADVLCEFSPDGERAEKFFEVTNAAARVVINAVLANEGSVDALDSRTVLGVFGSPLPLANHLEAALTAVDEVRRDLPNVIARRGREGLPAFQLRLWVHTGEAALGLIGVHDRGEYRVVGRAVDTVLSLKLPADVLDAKIVVTEAVKRAAPEIPQRASAIGRVSTPEGEMELYQVL